MGDLFRLFHCDYNPKEIDISNKVLFGIDSVQFWAEFYSGMLYPQRTILASFTWNNKNIRINGKPVFYRQFLDKACHKLIFTKK